MKTALSRRTVRVNGFTELAAQAPCATLPREWHSQSAGAGRISQWSTGLSFIVTADAGAFPPVAIIRAVECMIRFVEDRPGAIP